MGKIKAGEFLADLVAQYIREGFPLTSLTGEGDGQGRPDRTEALTIISALEAYGHTEVTDTILSEIGMSR